MAALVYNIDNLCKLYLMQRVKAGFNDAGVFQLDAVAHQTDEVLVEGPELVLRVEKS
jgi:hypothetical protein